MRMTTLRAAGAAKARRQNKDREIMSNEDKGGEGHERRDIHLHLRNVLLGFGDFANIAKPSQAMYPWTSTFAMTPRPAQPPNDTQHNKYMYIWVGGGVAPRSLGRNASL